MADLPRSEVLRLTAKLAGVLEPRYSGKPEVCTLVVPGWWMPDHDFGQFERLMDEAKISLEWDGKQWKAWRNGLSDYASSESRTEAGLQCAARVQLAKEGK